MAIYTASFFIREVAMLGDGAIVSDLLRFNTIDILDLRLAASTRAVARLDRETHGVLRWSWRWLDLVRVFNWEAWSGCSRVWDAMRRHVKGTRVERQESTGDS